MSVMMSVCFLRVSALSLVLGLRPPSIGPGCAVVPLSHRNCLRDRDAIERCFAGKVVHVYGNSVSRHWAYTLAYVLQGKAVYNVNNDWIEVEAGATPEPAANRSSVLAATTRRPAQVILSGCAPSAPRPATPAGPRTSATSSTRTSTATPNSRSRFDAGRRRDAPPPRA